jgi:transcriptional regulator GlxA family with amidase domain
LDDLARKAGMSKYHFVRLYKKLSGRTPMNDVRMIRVEAARDLIITTDLPLKTIATRVGLGNEYYLCRVFRQAFKVPPGYFRKVVP